MNRSQYKRLTEAQYQEKLAYNRARHHRTRAALRERERHLPPPPTDEELTERMIRHFAARGWD